jgi:hypothetical protein
MNDYLSENEKNISKRGIYKIVYNHSTNNLLVYLFKYDLINQFLSFKFDIAI